MEGKDMLDLGTTIRRGATALVVALAMIAGLATFGVGTASAREGGHSNVVGQSTAGKIVSTVKGKTSGGGKLGGTFTPIRAVQKDGVLSVKGFLEGVITDAQGHKTKFSGLQTIPVKSINGSPVTDARSVKRAAACNILNLVLGPLDLNILGLRVQLNQVKLDITAVPGAGNLLGNLLCAVAGLLDGGLLGGLLGQIQGLLNQILAALNLGL
jgi:hypothetical protein